jgi:hypothetical protein
MTDYVEPKRPEKMTDEMEAEYWAASERGDLGRCKEIIEACGLIWRELELPEKYKNDISYQTSREGLETPPRFVSAQKDHPR